MSPTRIALLGIATYVVIFIIAPVHIALDQSLLPYLYISLCYWAFFAGCFLAASRKPAVAHRETDRLVFSDDLLMQIHRVTTIVAIIGASLKLIDLFVIRDISLGGTFLDRRNELDTVGANPVSIVSAVLLPACLLTPFTWQLLRERGLHTRTQTIVTHLLLFVPALGSAMITGARNQAVIYAVIYMMYAVYLGRIRFRAKTMLRVLIGMLVLLVICIAIINSRLQAIHMRPLDSVYSSGYAFTLQPQQWITDLMENHHGLIGDFAFSLLISCQYYLHGVFELVYQIQNAPAQHIWGAASFNAYYKLLALLMNLPSAETLWTEVTVRKGIYTTFFGPVFSDFGWLGIAYMLGLGIFAQRMWEKSRAGIIGAVPIYMYLLYVIFLFPVVNSITTSMGLYTISAFVLFYWRVPRPKKEASPLRLGRNAGLLAVRTAGPGGAENDT